MSQTAVASDHAGFALKQILIRGIDNIIDLGPSDETSIDYPDQADLVVRSVLSGKARFGILICGSGQGMAMRANRHKGIRAALCWSAEIAELSRAHNDANILCLPGRFLHADEAIKIVEKFRNTAFEGGRHQRRVDKLCADKLSADAPSFPDQK